VTPWSVVKDENREDRPKPRYFRYAVISFTALLVLSLGFALIPAEPPPPADPPFSEQARASALEDALDLRATAEQLSAAAGAGGGPDTAIKAAVAERTVTLLTLQARTLLSPSESSTDAPAPASSSSPGLPQASTAVPATAPPTLEGLASALSASGVQRLADAAKADGGMARLLAGAGTAQLLAAENMAAAGGIPVETLLHSAGTPAPGTPAGATGSACPSLPPPVSPPTPAAGLAGQETPGTGSAAAVGSALSAALAAEQQNVYAYQAALPRLQAKDAGAARTFLAEHEDLTAEAAVHTRAACSAAQAQQPGYVLAPDFLAAPAAGLARLELESLPAFGDIIALADGGTRGWAISVLQDAARRAAHWGGDPGPVPGILLDQAQLPDLPAAPAPALTAQ
jgi:hypothetical protein